MKTVNDFPRLDFPPSRGLPRGRARIAASLGSAILAFWFGLAPAMSQTRTATFDEVRDTPGNSQVGLHGPFFGGANGIRFDVLGPSTFTPRDEVGLNGGFVSRMPQNGTPYLQQIGPNALIATAYLQSPLGVRFAVISVDLAEYSTVVDPAFARFVGYRTDGGVVTAEFMPDGIMDAEGPLVDFETYYFDDRFNDLIRFEAVEFASLDNLVFAQAVPEPTAMVLLAVGGLALTLGRQRMRR